jgi:hypothetical protein
MAVHADKLKLLGRSPHQGTLTEGEGSIQLPSFIIMNWLVKRGCALAPKAPAQNVIRRVGIA